MKHNWITCMTWDCMTWKGKPNTTVVQFYRTRTAWRAYANPTRASLTRYMRAYYRIGGN